MFKYLIFLVSATFSLNLAAQQLPQESTEEEREALRERWMELVETLLPEAGYKVTVGDFVVANGRAITYFQREDGSYARKQTIELLAVNEGGEDKVKILFTEQSDCILESDPSQLVITVNNKRINTQTWCMETNYLKPDGTRQRIKVYQPISDEAQQFIGLEMISTRAILLHLPSEIGYETPFAVRGFFEAWEKEQEPAL